MKTTNKNKTPRYSVRISIIHPNDFERNKSTTLNEFVPIEYYTDYMTGVTFWGSKEGAHKIANRLAHEYAGSASLSDVFMHKFEVVRKNKRPEGMIEEVCKFIPKHPAQVQYAKDKGRNWVQWLDSNGYNAPK